MVVRWLVSVGEKGNVSGFGVDGVLCRQLLVVVVYVMKLLKCYGKGLHSRYVVISRVSCGSFGRFITFGVYLFRCG